jgi:hypothetical protein
MFVYLLSPSVFLLTPDHLDPPSSGSKAESLPSLTLTLRGALLAERSTPVMVITPPISVLGSLPATTEMKALALLTLLTAHSPGHHPLAHAGH